MTHIPPASDQNCITKWLHRLAERGDRPAFHERGREMNYSGFAARIDAVARDLQKAGVAPGDVVMVPGQLSMRAVATLLATWKIGGVTAMSLDGETAKATILAAAQRVWDRDSEEGNWRCAVGTMQMHPLLAGLATRGGAGLVLFSSGTTGRPKPILHEAAAMLSVRPPSDEPRDYRLLTTMPLGHIGGLDGVMRSLAAGACVIVPTGTGAETVATDLETGAATVLSTSPTLLRMFLLLRDHVDPRRWSKLERIVYGAEPMPEGILEQLKSWMPGVAFEERFGISETDVSRVQGIPGQRGVRFADGQVESKVVDGELWLRTPTQMLGYLDGSDSGFTEDGWYRTGDWAELAPDGLVRVFGRQGTAINVGGRKVAAETVESAMCDVEGVERCRAFAEPNALMGQVVALEFVPRDGAEPTGIRSALRKRAREVLEPYQQPVVIRAVRTLDETRTGKLRR